MQPAAAPFSRGLRQQRLAWLCLGTALLAPALAVVPRAAHGFLVGPSLILPVMSALAWLLCAQRLAWPGPGRAWAWAAGLYALVALSLLAAAQWPVLLPKLLSENWSLPEIQTLWLRLGLGSAAFALGWAAWAWTPERLPRFASRTGLAFFAWLALSGALSGRPDLALRSLTEWGSYALCFAAAWLLSPGRARRLAVWLLLAGVLNSLYAWVQRLGLDPMHWNQTFAGRAMGFSGNPNYLGGFLALCLPLSLGLALDARPRVKALAWVSFGLLASAQLLTQTRGAWAGSLLGCALCLTLVKRDSPGTLTRQRPALALLTALSLLGLVLVLAQPEARERIKGAFSGQDAELSRRFFLMKSSARLGLDHPLFGVGPGNFRVQFPSVQARGIPLEALASHPYVVSDHAHNDFLHLAAEGGWLAALAWALILAWALRSLTRPPAFAQGSGVAGGQKDVFLLAGAAGGLAALSVHGLANFPFLMPATQAPAWALAAVALRQCWPSPVSVASGPLPGLKRSWTLAGLALILALAFQQGRSLAQDFFWWIGQGELIGQQHERAAIALLRAIGFDRREDQLWKLHGQAERGKEMVWNSIGSFREAVRLNPYDAEAGVRLGRSLVDNHEDAEAEAVLRRVSTYAPNFVDVWEPLAAACFQQKNFAEAVKAYDWMIYFKVNPAAAYANKGAALGQQGLPFDALQCLREGERLFPESGKIQLNIAITYLKQGDKARAREAWKKAAKLSPSDPQVDQLSGAFR